MIPENTQDDPKLLFVCEEKDSIQNLLALLNELGQERDFIFEKIKFEQKLTKFVKK